MSYIDFIYLCFNLIVIIMKEIIRKITIFGLSSEHPDGFWIQVGKTGGLKRGTVSSIVFREDLYITKSERVYTVKIKVPDLDDPNKGGIYKWKNIIVGSNHSVIEEYNTMEF